MLLQELSARIPRIKILSENQKLAKLKDRFKIMFMSKTSQVLILIILTLLFEDQNQA